LGLGLGNEKRIVFPPFFLVFSSRFGHNVTPFSAQMLNSSKDDSTSGLTFKPAGGGFVKN